MAVTPHTRELTIALDPDEANALVQTLCLALTAEGAELADESYDCPGELHALGRRASRIGAYAELGRALAWCKHWGPIGGTPAPVTAPEAVWLELLSELNERAEEVRRVDEMEPRDVFEFDRTARTVARAFATVEPAVVA